MKAKKGNSKITKPLIKSVNLFPVVGIGASAGGLDAFKRLLKAIPENSGMAYVLVQHLDPTHESMLPELLQKVTSIPVLEIADDIKVQPNHIYVIPSNKMMVATDGVLLLTTGPAKSKTERNLPIDLFFTSLAEVHQAHAIGVVLSGTASDGTLGLKAIKDHGGITFAQDEASAAYEGMPHSAAQAGVVDFILPPEKIPQKLLEVTSIIIGNGGDEKMIPQKDEDVFKQILSLLRIRKGTDFTYYKQTTIRRRILRRMALNKSEDPAAYLIYLRENKPEQDVLYQDLLIPVTSFFRDPKSFDNLCETVFPLIIKNKTAGEPIRVWVAGCSTGQEAYSIAMCLKEFLGDYQRSVQIFATDLSQPAITKARQGIYTKPELNTVTSQRLHEFFSKTNGSYQINKNVRDMCVFALHNFLKDPPFGKMDFISCRNVLIYMEPYLQKKALTTFHYSLNPKGFLLLGKSETISGVPNFFTSAAKNDKLFTRKDVPGRFMHSASQRSEENFSRTDATPNNEAIRTDFQKTADDIMLRKYTPAGVVVNETMDIVHFRGSTGSYLEQSSGKPSHNLLQMARNGLAFELRNILHKAKKEKATVIKENIPLEINGSLHNISIEAMPLPNTIEPHYLILFHDTVSTSRPLLPSPNSKRQKDDKDLHILQLEQELAQTREDMRSITEDQEAANEELQSANEELLSGSEELQSLNEELETGKEELQSTIEELVVVNHEISSSIDQITEARDYAQAIIATIHEPMIILDKDLRVKFANKSFYTNFHVKEVETEGVLLYDLGNKQWNIPRLRELLEDIIPKNSHFRDFEISHNFLDIGEKIMLLNASRIIQKSQGEKLILLAIADITQQKRIEGNLEKSAKEISDYKYALDKSSIVTITDQNGIIKFANDNFCKISKYSIEELIGQDHRIISSGYHTKKYISNLWTTIASGKIWKGELKNKAKDGTIYWLDSTIVPFLNEQGKPYQYIAIRSDITERKRFEQEITEAIVFAELATELAEKAKSKAENATQIAEEAVKAKQQFLSNMSHEIRTPMNAIVGFTNVVLKTDLNKEQKKYLDAIKISGDALIVLINDILDLAKVNEGKMTFEQIPFNLADSISAILQVFETNIQEKNLELVKQYDHTIPEVLVGDPLRLRQIILNLLSNAVKFTTEGKITASIRLLKEVIEKVTIEFIITDTGIGIPKDKLEKIFDNFGQADHETSRLYGGTGLGLAIVKKLVELQSGTVIVNSKVGEGSSFGFVLDFKKKNAKVESDSYLIETGTAPELFQNDSNEEVVQKNVKVLVVEDTPLNQFLMKILLADFGFEIDIAGNGKIAIEKLETNKYDIILMDLQMPEMNGFEATAHIRNKMNSQIPIIALTADVTNLDVEKSKAVGMNDYISKPIDEKLLYSKMMKYLKKSD